MGYDTTGYLLQAPRAATSNAVTTATPRAVVPRDTRVLPSASAYNGVYTPVFDQAADQYRCAVLENPVGGTHEYLLWAANTSSLARTTDASWTLTTGTGSFTAGTLTVGAYTDGTDTVVVRDNADRDLASITSISVTRGDNSTVVTDTVFNGTNPSAGTATLAAAALASLGGGISASRGDTVSAVVFTVAVPLFWWCRNGPDQTRFGWDGTKNRWAPFNGQNVANLGLLEASGTYKLAPAPESLTVGNYLPGSTVGDAWSMVRVGTAPNSTSTPVADDPAAPTFRGILVVADDDATAAYSWGAAPHPAAIVGKTSGTLVWNPAYVTAHAGKTVWYSPQQMLAVNTGKLGSLHSSTTSPLYIAPVPGPTEGPLITIGNRTPLTPTLVETDALLGTTTPTAGQVVVSLTSGQLKFAAADYQKADPSHGSFDKNWLGVNVYYRGLAGTTAPVPVRAPVQLVDQVGAATTVTATRQLHIPDSAPWGGLGISGIEATPDGYGLPPTTGTPGVRPGAVGLVRSWADGAFLFSKAGAVTLAPVDLNTDLPTAESSVPAGTATAALELTAGAGSRVYMGATERAKHDGLPLFYGQPLASPASKAGKAQIWARNQGSYTFVGGEKLYFAIRGSRYTWTASAGTFSASAIATSINATITAGAGNGRARALGDYLCLEDIDQNGSNDNLTTGKVEIAPGTGTTWDLSAAKILGFLPGWYVNNPSANDNWLPDSGLGYVLSRTPADVTSINKTADVVSRGRITDKVLTDNILPMHRVRLDPPPLEDKVGYKDGTYLKLVAEDNQKLLTHYTDVVHNAGDGYFEWAGTNTASGTITRPTSYLQLGQSRIYPDSLDANVSGGLKTSTFGSALTAKTLGTDFLMPDDGATGTVQLCAKHGSLVLSGANGAYTNASTTFTDTRATFITSGVTVGDRLKITGGSAATAQQGSYTVTAVPAETTLTISPAPTATASPVSYSVYNGIAASSYDPALVADQCYEEFNYLPTEVFTCRVLTSLGAVPANAGAQTASPLTAEFNTANRLGRTVLLRWGKASSSATATLTALSQTSLGTIANGSLFAPGASPATTRYTNNRWSLWVGATNFTFGASTLVKVVNFTNPVPAGKVEVKTSTGELAFAADVLTTYPGAPITYQEEFLDATEGSAGTVEYDPDDGTLRISSADLATYAGVAAHLVETCKVVGGTDVTLNAIAGSFAFKHPVRAGQLVEVAYTQAASDGAKKLDAVGSPITVTEVLPHYRRSETATRVTGISYTFNSGAKTMHSGTDPLVWVDADKQNYGATTATVDTTTNTISFLTAVSASSTVQISYATEEAVGGEQAYTVSTGPIYRPPFTISKGATTFTVEGDRTSVLVAGKLIRLGGWATYVQASSYAAGTGLTTCTIFPAPPSDVGSTAPGQPALTLISGTAVGTIINPTGAAVVTSAAAGFWLALAADYQAAGVGHPNVMFVGNLSSYAVAGHLLELGGEPYTVAGHKLINNGRFTQVMLTSPLRRAYINGTDAALISARPVYAPGTRALLGLGPILRDQGHEVVLYGTNGIGKTLAEGLDYTLTEAGGINFSSRHPAFAAGQKVYLRHTRQTVLKPREANGLIQYPTYSAGYTYASTPSATDGRLSKTLKATYSYSSPDSWYVRAVPLLTYLAEVETQTQADVQATLPGGGGGPLGLTVGSSHQQGQLDANGRALAAQDKDRAAQVFLDFYNRTVTAFEQIEEAVTGTWVGDRDGKFRHYVGSASRWPKAGHVDPATGRLVTRNVWSEVFLNETAASPIRTLEADNVVDPTGAAQAGDAIPTGTVLSADRYKALLPTQRKLTHNDIDDRVLVSVGPVKVTASASPVTLTTTAKGLYADMGESHTLSRVLPTETTAFGTTRPGTYGFLTTNGQPIGQLANPPLGNLTGISNLILKPRLARGWVIGYSAIGYASIHANSANRPAVLVSMVPPSQFPWNEETGLPDLTQLKSQNANGTVNDLLTGDPAMHVPAWSAYSSTDPQQVAFGKPDGTLKKVGYGGSVINVFGGLLAGGVFVDEVLSGCVITFRGEGALEDITDPTELLDTTTDPIGSGTYTPAVGDTIYLVTPTSLSAQPLNPLDSSKSNAGAFSPVYREGLDYKFRGTTGEILDNTLPSLADPSFLGLKDVLGQRPLAPQQQFEAEVSFNSTATEPVKIPALEGGSTNDAGDRTIPYKAATETELQALGDAARAISTVLRLDTNVPSAQYPNEFIISDGRVRNTPDVSHRAGVLTTATDMQPVGVYTAHSGIGNVQQGDLVIIQTGQSGPDGTEGIHEVGAVEVIGGDTVIEPPRFVTQTRQGDRFRYTFNNAIVHVAGDTTTGIIVSEPGGGVTTFDITNVAGLVWNDGQAGNNGGLNNIFSNTVKAYPNNNLVRIKLYDTTDGSLVETITISGSNASGGLGAQVMGSVPVCSPTTITVSATGFVDFGAVNAATKYTFTVDVDTWNGALANAGSDTGYINSDRVTFHERYMLTFAGRRGETTQAPNSISVEGNLDVIAVTAPHTDNLSVNGKTECNGGQAFTFVADNSNTLGSFSSASLAGAGDELSSLKVQAFEGHSNTVLNLTSLKLTVLPSTPNNGAGAICAGKGRAGSAYGGYADAGYYEHCIRDITTSSGSTDNVLPGDILVITQADVVGGETYANAIATTKCGTYIVRHKVTANTSNTHRNLTLSAKVGTNAGWVKTSFPKVVSFDQGANELTVDTWPTVTGSPTGGAFASSGRVYVLADVSLLANGDVSVAKNALASAAYTGIDAGNKKFTGLSGWKDAGGNVLTEDQFAVFAAAGKRVSGAIYFELDPNNEQGLPSNNTVGWHNTGSNSLRGFTSVTVTGLATSTAFTHAAGNVVEGAPAAGKVGVAIHSFSVSGTYKADVTDPVYAGVPSYLDLSGVNNWDTLHHGHGGGFDVDCLLPGNTLVSSFNAQAGIFLEPSSPRPVPNLNGADEHLVDSAHTLPTGVGGQIGFRSGPAHNAAAQPEVIRFVVRRARRWQAALDSVGSALSSLKYVYQLRKGTVTAYSTTGPFGILGASAGTTVGNFDVAAVGIHAGALFRLLDANGNLIEECRVAGVRSGTELLLATPGLQDSNPVGKAFEIYLLEAPVPHEQSCKELLTAITDSVIRTATTGSAATVNQLTDTGVGDHTTLGVQAGDIVLVDPAGIVKQSAPQERGAAPAGDKGVSGRGGYTAGSPSALDDNRGFYRCQTPVAGHIPVTPNHTFAGTNGSDVIKSTGGTAFAVLPTVHGSNLPATNDEGQNDLRVTSVAVAGSFLGSPNSVGPFSYKIIRPTSLLSATAIDLALHMRERVLTWIDILGSYTDGSKSGSYFIWQRDAHAAQVGDPADPQIGKGVLSNAAITLLEGEVGTAPYLNSATAISILDRRVWLEDARLDKAYPPYSGGGTKYTTFAAGTGLPLQQQHLANVLQWVDDLRGLRYAWLNYRINRVSGSKAEAARQLALLPTQEQEAQRLVKLLESLAGR